MINYSGRASELGSVVSLVDQRQFSLSRSERPPFSSEVDSTFNERYAVEIFSISLELRKKFLREVPLFLWIPEFP